MTTENADSDDGSLVKYEITDDVFSPPDEHREVGEGEYVCEYIPKIDQWESAEMIEVLSWDYQEDDGTIYSGGLELIRDDVGNLYFAVPTKDGRGIKQVGLGEWVCKRCGTKTDCGPVSRGGEIPEPHECSGCERQGPFQHFATQFGTTQDRVNDEITTDPIWKLPSGFGEASFSETWDKVYDHIYTHWDAGDREWLYEGLTAYAMSTWFREAFDFVPHLLLVGPHETGKTRLLNTLKGVSYRAVNTASASPASIYRAIDQHNMTLYLSEYHDIEDDAQKVVDSVLKMGQKRGEVALRAEEMRGGGYDIKNFQPFTHVAISTQFEPRDDIKSRCFRIVTQPSKRSIPRTIADTTDIKNDLLNLRYSLLGSSEIEAAQQRAVEYLDENDLKGRISEKLWCLLTVAELADRDISKFVEKSVEMSSEGKSESDEAYFIQACIDEAFKEIRDMDTEMSDPWPELAIKLTDIREAFNKQTDRDVANQYMGTLRSRVGIGKVRRSDGSHIKDPDLKAKLKQLAEDHNISFEPNEDLIPDRPEDSGDSAEDDERADSSEPTPQMERVGAIRQGVKAAGGVDDPTIDDVVERMTDNGYVEEKVRHDIDRMITEGLLINDGDTLRVND